MRATTLLTPTTSVAAMMAALQNLFKGKKSDAGDRYTKGGGITNAPLI